MKFDAEIDGQTHVVEMRREGRRIFAKVNERMYELDSQETQRGNLLLTLNSRVFNCRVEGIPQSGQPVSVTIASRSYVTTLTDPKRLRASSRSGSQADHAAQITAPMPGKVVRVLVGPGMQVEAGAGIIVVEAMKMQNEMKSPKAGMVTAVNVQAGETVNAGDVLAIVE